MKKSIYFVVCLGMASCSSFDTFKAVKIKEGTALTELALAPPTENQDNLEAFYLKKYIVTDKTLAFIEIKNNKPELSFISKQKPDTIIEIPEDLSRKLSLAKHASLRVPYYYEYEGIILDLKNRGLFASEFSDTIIYKTHFKSGNKFRYSQPSSNLQTLTIPFKLRPKQDGAAAQITTGINVGFGYAFKKSYKTYLPISFSGTSEPKGYKESEFEIGFMPFMGITSIDLNSKNTNNEVSSDIKVFGLDIGGMITIGLNKLDLGVGFGIDHGLTKSAKNWIYQDQVWYGFAVGLDLIK